MGSREDQSEAFLTSDTICDDFFISIVERKLKISSDKFKLRLVMLQPATGKNDNFVSVVYRAKIKIELLESGERQSIDVVIKALLSVMEEMKKFSVFPRERFMYEDVIESLENIWVERANEVVKFAPQHIKFETDPYEIIILDDLKANGYEMLDKKVGLTLTQTKLALAKLAKFHAASSIRYQKVITFYSYHNRIIQLKFFKDGIIQVFLDRKLSMPPEMMTADNPFMKGFIRMYEEFIAAIRSYGDCDKYADKIASWDQQKLLSCWISIAEPMRNGFIVLAHGDAWLNNMMFRSDEDVLLLDFQGCSWASPALDLEYFIISSVSDDIKVTHYDEMIKFYHEELTESLIKLKYDMAIPTYEELQEDLLEKGAMGMKILYFD